MRRRRTFLTLIACALTFTAGCGSSSDNTDNSAAAQSDARAAEFSRLNTPSPTPTSDPNDTACATVADYVTNEVKPTFSSWDVNANEFDTEVGDKLREHGTHLYGLARGTTGSVSDAITDEAKALINISIAIDAENDDDLGTAATAANTSLATLRGACDF